MDSIRRRLSSFRKENEKKKLEEEHKQAEKVPAAAAVEEETEQGHDEDSCTAEPSLLERIERCLIHIFVWLIFFILSVYLEFGCVYALISALLFLWYSTSKRSKRRSGQQLSAYSVFNEGCTRLPGQLTAEHFDDMYRRGGGLL